MGCLRNSTSDELPLLLNPVLTGFSSAAIQPQNNQKRSTTAGNLVPLDSFIPLSFSLFLQHTQCASSTPFFFNLRCQSIQGRVSESGLCLALRSALYVDVRCTSLSFPGVPTSHLHISNQNPIIHFIWRIIEPFSFHYNHRRSIFSLPPITALSSSLAW